MILRVLIFLVFVSNAMASVTDDLLKLSNMYNEGLLTKEEFTKAKSILLQIEDIEVEEKSLETIVKKKDTKTTKKKKIVKKSSNKSKIFDEKIKIQRIYTTEGSKFTNKNFEKMKLTVGDFLIYTHRPGAVKIKQISTNKQLAVIGDRLKVKYYNRGQDFFNAIVNEQDKELILEVNGIKVLVWKGQYVQQANATFYQILGMGRLPFHFYVKLDVSENAAALNMERFNRKIELAVDDVKKKLSVQYNLSIEQIDGIILENDMMAVYGEQVPTNVELDKTFQKKTKLYAELKESLGEENFSMLKSNVDAKVEDALSKEVNEKVKSAIDESIREAIHSGVSTAAIEAAINAFLDALMSGASFQDAYDKAQGACTGSGSC